MTRALQRGQVTIRVRDGGTIRLVKVDALRHPRGLAIHVSTRQSPPRTTGRVMTHTMSDRCFGPTYATRAKAARAVLWLLAAAPEIDWTLPKIRLIKQIAARRLSGWFLDHPAQRASSLGAAPPPKLPAPKASRQPDGRLAGARRRGR